MQQYFINQELSLHKTIPLAKDIQFHLKTVLKSKPDTMIRLVDYHGHGFLAKVNHDFSMATLIENIQAVEDSNTKLTLIMGLIKKEKLELTLAKATELGVSRIVLLQTQRSVVKFSEKDIEKKIKRFHTIVKEAAEVSYRLSLPEIIGPLKINDLKDYQSDLNYVLYENTQAQFKLPSVTSKQSISVIVGPEGGLSLDEIAQLKDLGFHEASLTHRILRAETAAIMACVLCGGYYG